MKSKLRLSSVYFLLGALLTVSCASNRTVENVAVNATASDNPSEQIAELEKGVSDAKSRHADVLSPTWYSAAVESLKKAKTLRYYDRTRGACR